MEFSPNGSILAIAGDDGTAVIWNAISGQISANLSNETAVTELSFSMDSKRLVTVTKDNIMHFWDLSSHKKLASINLKNKLIFTNGDKSSWFKLSQDGFRVAIGLFSDKTITVYDTGYGKEIFKLYSNGIINNVAFSPTGTELAAANTNGTILIWDAVSRRLLNQKTYANSVKKLAFSPKGDVLAVTTSEPLIDLWNWKSSNQCEKGTMIPLSGPINDLTFSPDGTMLATTSSDNAARVWDTESGRELERVEHNGAVRDVAFVNGSGLVTISDDDTARISNIHSNEDVVRMQYLDPVQSVSFTPDGTGLITDRYKQIYNVTYIDVQGRRSTFYEQTERHEPLAGYMAKSISLNRNKSLWNLSYGFDINLTIINEDFSRSNFSILGSRIANAVGNESRIFDVVSGVEISKIDNERLIDVLALSIDGSKLAAADNSTVTIWDVSSRQKLAEMKHNSSVNDIEFPLKGSFLATASNDNTSRIWDLTGKELHKLEHNGPIVNSIFTYDGSRLVTRSREPFRYVPNSYTAPNGTIYIKSSDGKWLEISSNARTEWQLKYVVSIWDISSGDRLAQISDDAFTDSIFSPSRLIFADDDENGNITIHDAVTGSEIRRIKYKGTVLSFDISPDGSSLALGCDDGTAQVWNLTNGREMVSLKHKSPVIALAFSPNGSKLATGIQDGTASVWLWRSEDLIREACSRLTRNLTLDEWRLYLGDEPYQETCACQGCKSWSGS